MERTYETRGYLYIISYLQGERGLISLDYSDYQNLLAHHMMDEEVHLSLRKACFGAEYEQGAPEMKTKAGLSTITVEATSTKPQLNIDEQALTQARQQGFRDGDEVLVGIKPLPFHHRCEAFFEEVPLEIAW